ncbi:MAG: hypothetical protein V4533_05765 [Pseudomonadota bacterium]|uniref:hypothetical protein n=1 Tax=Sphingobium sp. CECT 9361 TaxID=2845384 RepID=UPI001E5559C2|nr:hypothetical protein [Sphingobium sp. CECT 9361]
MAALLMIGPSDIALACAAPRSGESLSKDEVLRATKAQFEHSDAIIDAIVFRDTRGNPFLKPIKIWKGQRQKAYAVKGDGCGVYLPEDGQRVRVLLYRDEHGWVLVQPIVSYGRGMPSYDGIIDSYLRSPRPSSFQSVGPMMPPLP